MDRQEWLSHQGIAFRLLYNVMINSVPIHSYIHNLNNNNEARSDSKINVRLVLLFLWLVSQPPLRKFTSVNIINYVPSTYTIHR